MWLICLWQPVTPTHLKVCYSCLIFTSLTSTVKFAFLSEPTKSLRLFRGSRSTHTLLKCIVIVYTAKQLLARHTSQHRECSFLCFTQTWLNGNIPTDPWFKLTATCRKEYLDLLWLFKKKKRVVHKEWVVFLQMLQSRTCKCEGLQLHIGHWSVVVEEK